MSEFAPSPLSRSRLFEINLDQATIARKNPNVEHEREVAIFDILESMNIPRVCFYHLVYAGRGSDIVEQDLDHEETRRIVDVIEGRGDEAGLTGE